MVAAGAQAHRLDETLVGSLVLLSPARISVQVDITPGTLLAREVHDRIDLDRNGVISAAERTSLGAGWARQVRIQLDGAERGLRVLDCEVPDLERLLAGDGIIRINAALDGVPDRGVHKLSIVSGDSFPNPVFAVNALKPVDDRIRILRQDRDAGQRVYAVDYEIAGRGWWPWRRQPPGPN